MKRVLLCIIALCTCVLQSAKADGGDPSKYTSATEILPNRAPDFTLDDVTTLYNEGKWTYTIYKNGETTGDHVTIRVIGGSQRANVMKGATFTDKIGTYNGDTEFTVTADAVKLCGGAVLQIESSKGRIQSIHFGNVAKRPVTGKSQSDANRNVNLYPFTGNGYYGTYVWDDNTTFTKGHGVSKQLVETNSVNFLTLGDPSNKDGEYVMLYNSTAATNKTSYETSTFGINIWVDESDTTAAVSPTIVEVKPASVSGIDTENAFGGPKSVTVKDGETDVTSNYTIKYVMAGMKPAATTTDPHTGTVVNRTDGSGTTGATPGTAVIGVVAVPNTKKYNMAFGEYSVTSSTTTEVVMPYLPKNQDGIILYTYPDQWNSLHGTTTYVGAEVHTNKGKDITDDYTLTYSLSDETYATLGTGDCAGRITSKTATPDNTHPTLKITATKGSETLTKEVKVTVKALKSDDKLNLSLFYPEGKDSIMVYSKDRFYLPAPNVKDEYGNLLVVNDNNNFVVGKHIQNPHSVKLQKSEWTMLYFDSEIYGVGIYSNQAADFGLDTISVYYKPSGPYVTEKKDIVTQYGTRSDGGFAKDSVYFKINCQLRIPELSFSPEEVTLFQGGKLTPQNRLHLTARFYDRSSDNYDESGKGKLLDASKTLVYGSDFYYALYIPDSLKDEIEVTGFESSNIEKAHYTDYATGKEVDLPGMFYWTKNQWNNDNWQITFKKRANYDLQYYIRYWNEYTYRTGSPVTATTLRYNVIKIPTYSVSWEADTITTLNHWTQVTTTNEKTNIRMFYGGWRNGSYYVSKGDSGSVKNNYNDYTFADVSRKCDKKGTNRIAGWEYDWNDKWTADSCSTYGKSYAYKYALASDSIKNATNYEIENSGLNYTDTQKDSVLERNVTIYANELIDVYNTDSLHFNGYIDYFDTYLANKDDNAMDECDQQYTSYNYREGSYFDYLKYKSNGNNYYYNTAFTVPCKGNYLRFEPEEDGIVLLYLVQNGLCDYTGAFNKEKETDNDGLCQMKWRPLFITDEKGKPVEMVDDDATLFTDFCLDDTIKANHNGYYTQSVLRAAYNDANVIERVKNISGAQTIDGFAYDWQKFQGTKDDSTRIVNVWKNLNLGAQQSVIKLDNGGYVLLTKGYVRYTFPVKAGKTYFVMQGGSKPEVGGFSFIPEDYQPDGSRSGVTVPDITLYTRSGDTGYQPHETVMNAISDSTNVNVTFKGHRIRNNEWTSFCLPFSLSESRVNELFGEKAIVLTPDTMRNGAMHFTQHAYRIMVAGRPYLVKPTGLTKDYGKDDDFVFKNVTIENTDPVIYNDTIGGFVFRGFYDPIVLKKGEYFVSKDGLYRSTADEYTHPGYSAIFANPTQASASIAAMDINIVGEDGNTSGILEIRDNGNGQYITDVSDEKVYTLDGRYVGKNINTNTLPSGIYVRGGQKIIVK